MDIIFKKAGLDDLKDVVRIYDNIHAEIESKGKTVGWVRGVYPVEATAKAAINRGDMFIELADGKTVGTGIINKTQVDVYADAPWQYRANDDEVMVLHTLVIDPDASGAGFGKAFVKFYEEYAKKSGAKYLRIDTNEKNVVARAFYKKLGFDEIAVVPCDFNGIRGINLVLLEKKI